MIGMTGTWRPVGSVATDRIETPFGTTDGALGGAATYFSAAASLFHAVQLVGVIGDYLPAGRVVSWTFLAKCAAGALSTLTGFPAGKTQAESPIRPTPLQEKP